MARASGSAYHHGATIREFRFLRGMTQEKLAALWPKTNGERGVLPRYVQDVEHGRKHIDRRGTCAAPPASSMRTRGSRNSTGSSLASVNASRPRCASNGVFNSCMCRCNGSMPSPPWSSSATAETALSRVREDVRNGPRYG